jgi:hypothetical protein
MALVLDGTNGVSGVDGTASNPSLEGTDSNTGVFFPSADTVAIGTGGTEALRVDSARNVGIGTSSITYRVDVSAGNGQGIRFTDTVNSVQNFLGAYNSVGLVGTLSNHPVSFWTNNAERARITSGGYFKASNNGTYVGSTGTYHEMYQSSTNQVTCYFGNNSTTPAGLQVTYLNAAPNGTGNEFLYCSDTGAQRATIRSNGGLANYSANNVNLSDRREKTNFAPAKNYLDIICAIPVQTFNYIDQNLEEDDGLTLGVVAQDVQAVAPELVMESNWAGKDEEPKMRLSIYQTDLQYALMKSIQELKAIVDAQAAEIAALKGTA